jgi:multidrug resistance efflux pump
MTQDHTHPPIDALLPERGAWDAPLVATPALDVPEPMSVVWQGVEYTVARWDVSGFTLQAPIPRVVAPGVGRVFDATLLIGQGGTRIEMRVQARAQSNDPEHATRYVFVDLERAQAEVLHRIVDHVVADQAMSLTRLLNETQETRSARAETGERMRLFRTGFQVTLAVAVLAVAGLMTLSSMTSVRARYAAVTVGATSLSVPLPGRVSALTVRPGESVAEGDVLGYVRPSDHEERLQRLIDRRRALQAEQAELMDRSMALTELEGLQSLGTERSRLEDALRLAERRLSVERAALAAMQGNGLPTAARLRERARQEAAVLQAETDVLDARSRLDRLARDEVTAPLAAGGGDLRGGARTREALNERLAVLAEDIANLAEREAHGAYGDPIVSPCDCVVQSLERRVGEWSDPEDQLAVLVGNEHATVHALILSENARSIELGDRARIELADGTDLAGTVARMNYQARWLGYTGLQDNVFAADRYARVEIAPERPLNAPVGMVAQVTVDTNALLATLRSFVGL